MRSAEVRRRQAEERRNWRFVHDLTCPVCLTRFREILFPKPLPAFERQGGLPPRDPVSGRFLKADRPEISLLFLSDSGQNLVSDIIFLL